MANFLDSLMSRLYIGRRFPKQSRAGYGVLVDQTGGSSGQVEPRAAFLKSKIDKVIAGVSRSKQESSVRVGADYEYQVRMNLGDSVRNRLLSR